MAASGPEFVRIVLTGHDMVAPVDALMAPMPRLAAPFSVAKWPPTTTLPVPAGTVSVRTSASADGAHVVTAPVVAFTEASRERPWLPTTVKAPPRYRVEPETSRSLTHEFALALNPVITAPVDAFSATTRLRPTPLTDVKSPPT